jgi:hypothetical protein
MTARLNRAVRRTGAKKAQVHSRTDAVNMSASAASSRCRTGEPPYSWGSAHGSRPDPQATNQQTPAVRPPNSGGHTLNILSVPANTPDTRPFTPGKAQITPPDETMHVTLDRPYGGALWCQAGAASSPETSVRPIDVG